MGTTVRRRALVLVAVAALGASLIACDASDEDDAASGTGTITISMEGVEGLDGYRLLAGVWARAGDTDLVGGAFWTIVDSDPFSADDQAHPPNTSDVVSDDAAGGWAADDYLWDETAALVPGAYRVQLWANPGELLPYGSHLPAEPIERGCVVDVDVAAGESTAVTITGVPAGDRGMPCP